MTAQPAGPDQRWAAEAFGLHLRRPGRVTAEPLARELAEIGDTQVADALLAFAARGAHVVPAADLGLEGWSPPEARCHLGLTLPNDAEVGDLWFDPLEVGFALTSPWVRDPAVPPAVYQGLPTLHGWIALRPTTHWQLLGARNVAAALPDTLTQVNGDQAHTYCYLFGKGLAGSLDWVFLKHAFGEQVWRRVWGEAAAQFGDGGAQSGTVEYLHRDAVRGWSLGDDLAAPAISETDHAGLAFRSWASCQSGLWTGDGSLPRIWHLG